MSADIEFFDLLYALPAPASPNTWKVRLALNYKKLQYRTIYLLTSDVESTLKSLGVAPTSTKPNGEPHYTVPAIIDRTDPSRPVIISDSTPIIEYLETVYPPPPGRELLPTGTASLQILFADIVIQKIFGFIPEVSLTAMYKSKYPKDQAQLRTRMEGRFGKPLENIEKQGPEREAHYKEMEKTFTILAKALKKNGGGPFFLGESVSLADFTLAGALIYINRVGADEMWPKVSQWDAGYWKDYLHKFLEWMAVDNYPTSA